MAAPTFPAEYAPLLVHLLVDFFYFELLKRQEISPSHKVRFWTRQINELLIDLYPSTPSIPALPSESNTISRNQTMALCVVFKSKTQDNCVYDCGTHPMLT